MQPITKIIINGKELNAFTHVSLNQKMYDHHNFKVVVGHEIIESQGINTLDKSKDWLGKAAILLFGNTAFIGIVTSVNLVHNHGLHGDLVISGYSQTILLESGDNLCSWTEKALRDIVDEVMSGLDSEVKPKYQDTIGYLTQYRESNFGFLRRIACQYNEWFFYDGQKLIFGEPGDKPTVPLFYGTDVNNIQVSLRVRPVKYNAFSYHSLRDEQIDGVTKDSVGGLDELGMHAFNTAKETFTTPPVTYADPRIPDKGSLDDVLEKLQSAAAANLSMVSGSSTKQDIRPGVIVDFKVKIKDADNTNNKPIGRYLVTSVHHQATGEDGYTNYFEAVPAEVKVLPEPEIKRPVAYPQIATVLSNEDPEKKGRIQVQFQWQLINDLNTNWIRVMAPDAGISDKVGTNRGFVCIPEKDDQVLIQFRYGDPDRPFVLGSMFHGMSGAGGDTNNKIKSITTRSGSTIIFDDDENDGKITIQDPSGNTVTLNGDKTMSIFAPDKIDMASKEINIYAENTVNIKGDQEANMSSLKTNIAGDTKVDISSKATVVMGAPTTEISGTAHLKLKGLLVDMEGQTVTNIKGNVMLNLNC